MTCLIFKESPFQSWPSNERVQRAAALRLRFTKMAVAAPLQRGLGVRQKLTWFMASAQDHPSLCIAHLLSCLSLDVSN
jgi:hypothetical protein